MFLSEIFQRLNDSFTCSNEESFVFCKKILEKVVFHKKHFCTVKESKIIDVL